MPGNYRIQILSSIKGISCIIGYDTIEIPIDIKADEQKFSMYVDRDTILYTKENWYVMQR